MIWGIKKTNVEHLIRDAKGVYCVEGKIEDLVKVGGSECLQLIETQESGHFGTQLSTK